MLSAALLKTFSHQLNVNCSEELCPTPVLSNFNFGFRASEIPFSFLPNPLPKIVKIYVG